jgi:L-asparaginase
VRKTHSTHPGAFTSPNLGPIGMVRDGRAWLHAVLPAHEAIPPPARSGDAAPRVALLESVLGDDAELLRLVAGARYDGVVLGGFGVGHVCFAVAEEVSSLARHIPVVFASRTGAGGTHRRTYGFPGSEADLVARGAQPAGLLDHRKARLLLWATLAAGAGREEVARQFDLRGTG